MTQMITTRGRDLQTRYPSPEEKKEDRTKHGSAHHSNPSPPRVRRRSSRVGASCAVSLHPNAVVRVAEDEAYMYIHSNGPDRLPIAMHRGSLELVRACKSSTRTLGCDSKSIDQVRCVDNSRVPFCLGDVQGMDSAPMGIVHLDLQALGPERWVIGGRCWMPRCTRRFHMLRCCGGCGRVGPERLSQSAGSPRHPAHLGSTGSGSGDR